MQINVSTRHGQISAETRAKITEKMTKLTRFHERMSSVEVLLDLEHEDDPGVELKVSVDRSQDFVAREQAGTLWASIDLAIDKLVEQLRRANDRRKDHSRPALKRAEMPAPESDETTSD